MRDGRRDDKNYETASERTLSRKETRASLRESRPYLMLVREVSTSEGEIGAGKVRGKE